jgi:hypothetical protein
VTLRGDCLLVSGPPGAEGAATERWYRATARRALGAAVERESRRLDLAYRSIAIRDQRTRWGSCSDRGTLSFSWRLVVVPAEVLDYVVVHELCHLREMNHSRAFWRLLDDALPGWPDHEAWLTEHGRELRSYRPETAFRPAGVAGPAAVGPAVADGLLASSANGDRPAHGAPVAGSVTGADSQVRPYSGTGANGVTDRLALFDR